MKRVKGFHVGAWVKCRSYRKDEYWDTLPYGLIHAVRYKMLTITMLYFDDYHTDSRFKTTEFSAEYCILFVPTQEEQQVWMLEKMKQ